MYEDKKTQWTLDLIQKLLDAHVGKPEILQNIKNALDEGKVISEGYKTYLKERFAELNGLDTSSNIVDKDTLETKDKQNKKTEPTKTPIEPEDGTDSKPDSEFCGKCGGEISDKSSNFCAKCGTPRENISESYCGNCGQKKIGNQPCRHCINSQSVGIQRHIEWKSEGTTLVLSIVLGLLGLQGIGHIYVGKVGKGIGILIVSLILFALGWTTIAFGVGAIFLIIYVIMFFWQIFNSRTLCREYNEFLERHGRKPW